MIVPSLESQWNLMRDLMNQLSVLIEVPSTNPRVDPGNSDGVELAVAKGRATGISAPNLYQRNKETDPEEAMTTYGVFIASADKWNGNTPMNTVHQGERSSEHMLLQKEPSSLMSMTFDSESISRFRTRMSQSQLPWIRRLARIDCLAKTQTVFTVTSPKEG